MYDEVPALYDVARQVCHDLGLDWTDPRTGRTHRAPKAARAARVKRTATAKRRAKLAKRRTKKP